MKKIELDELRALQLGILKHVDLFCREHSIKYFVCGGTMIGAVRHKGYIPWDDDIDIMMLRDDYERFAHEYRNNDTSPYKLHLPEDEKYNYTFGKIEDTRTIWKENVTFKYEMGVNIDVFPIDTVPEEEALQKKMYRRLSFFMSLMQLKNVVPSKHRSVWKNTVLLVAHLLLKPLSMRLLSKKIVDNALQYRNRDSRFCGIAVWGYGMREINLRSNWTEVQYLPFENMEVPVPVGFDNYLTCVYGDYMQLPPEEKRVTHHGFKAYWI